MGHMLLKWFLKDGKIRGVDNNGNVYTHAVAEELVERFIEEMHVGR